MLRVLNFEGNQKRFDLLWEGWVFGTKAAQFRAKEPNVATSRLRAKISRKLKLVSTEGKRTIVQDIKHRELLDSAYTSLQLEQPEHDLLVKTLEETEWSPESIDDAFDMIDWVSAADKKD